VWENVWTMNVANEVRVLKFSPDGTLFATYGENDRLVKIWFPQGGFLHSRDSRESIKVLEHSGFNFSFIYIQHPASVCGIEWRRTSRYMPRYSILAVNRDKIHLKNFRKSIQNVLITWCEDNTSRIWKETPFHDSNLDSLLEAVDSVTREKQKRKHKHASIKKAGNKLISRLSHLT
jgi:DmX-like protein